jgi:hypothetical protein
MNRGRRKGKSRNARYRSELERLEDEMERKVEEGKRALRELDEKRKVCFPIYMIWRDGADVGRLLMLRLMRRLIRRLLSRRYTLGAGQRPWDRLQKG